MQCCLEAIAWACLEPCSAVLTVIYVHDLDEYDPSKFADDAKPRSALRRQDRDINGLSWCGAHSVRSSEWEIHVKTRASFQLSTCPSYRTEWFPSSASDLPRSSDTHLSFQFLPSPPLSPSSFPLPHMSSTHIPFPLCLLSSPHCYHLPISSLLGSTQLFLSVSTICCSLFLV